MAYLHEQMEKLKWDKRMVNFNIKRGVVTEDELKNYRDSQPDEASKVETFTLDEDIMDANQSTAPMPGESMENTASSPFVEDQNQMGQPSGSHTDEGGGFGGSQF